MGMFDSIPLLASLVGLDWGFIALVTLVIVMFCGGILGTFLYFAYLKKTTGVIEIDYISRRLQTFTAKVKKDMLTHGEKMWIGKYRKFIDKVQQKNMFYKRNRDTLILVRDLNGLHHPLHIFSLDECIEYFQKVKGIDITKEYVTVDGKEMENPYYKYHEVYAMPNPSESLDWLGKECIEAAEEFKEEKEWWQHPYFAYVATGFICFLMITITLIFRGKI